MTHKENLYTLINDAEREAIHVLCGLDDSLDDKWLKISIQHIEEGFLAIRRAVDMLLPK